jgi:hypothetical protein
MAKLSEQGVIFGMSYSLGHFSCRPPITSPEPDCIAAASSDRSSNNEVLSTKIYL